MTSVELFLSFSIGPCVRPVLACKQQDALEVKVFVLGQSEQARLAELELPTGK